MAISTTPCRGTSVAAAPTCASVRGSSTRRAVRRTASRERDMADNRMDLTESDDVDLSRRRFLSVSAAVGGGLLIGFTAGRSIRDADAALSAAAAAFTPNAFIRIGGD